MRFIANVWHGNYPLWVSFWILAFLPFLLTVVATAAAFSSMIPHFENKENALWPIIIIGVVGRGYCFIALKGAWSAARKYTGRDIWAAFAYLGVFLLMPVTLKSFAMGLLLLYGSLCSML